jgi:predicted Zn-dependent protease
LLAHIDLQSGDRAAAEDQFEAALLLNPASKDAFLALAKEYLADRRFDDVVELLEPRCKDASVSVDVLQLLMKAYAGAGRTADAEKVRARVETLQHRH